MAKDNNNINITDELASGGGNGAGGGAGSSSAETLKQHNRLISGDQQPDLNGRINGQLGGGHSSAAEGINESVAISSSQQRDSDGVTAIHELPRREENPFSFKHFLKRDSSLGAGTSSSNASAANINHSRSASSINGGNIGNGVVTVTTTATILSSASSQPSTSGASPSKSATTSSLHNSASTTGAKPKIPQFQSVNTLSSESKMKRSPRFPSFDSQSSLSDLADDKFMAANIYHSRSNNSSFSSDYPLGGAGSGVGGGGTGSQQYVQRSYSNYDLESPGSVESPRLVGSQNLHNSPNFGGGGGRSRENLAASHRLGASEFSAALPDFVQDHLVMEQWYNQMGSPKSGSPVSVDFDHLPDFAVNNLESDASGRGHGSIINDMPFDLTAAVAGPSCSSSQSAAHRTNRTPLRNTSPNVPLDLPPQNMDFSFDLPRRRTTPPAAAPELPPDLTGNSGAGNYFRGGGVDNHSPPPSGSSADKIHRLPDFLSDGPIHSSGRLADVTQHDTPHFNSPDAEASHSQLQRLQIERQENDRLRRELEDNRRIVAEQARRISELERALEVAKSSAHRVEGFEENLDKSYLRAATAESQVLSLRQKMKKLASDMEALRLENDMLKEEGAVGGASSSSNAAGACGGGPGPSGIRSRRGHSSSFSRAQELSRELRQAAASAENNLRQLLTGVDNLRMMASTIENIDRIDITSHPDDFLSDSDDDDLLGPAL